MGRPKSLRQKEVTPSISIDVNAKPSKHISFGDDDANISLIGDADIVLEPIVNNENSSITNEIIDTKPEVISSKSDEILKLKNLYEKMIEPLNKKLKKKRKAASVKLINQDLLHNNNDKELDTTLLEYLSKNGLEYEDNQEDEIFKKSKRNSIDDDNNNDDDIKSKFKVNSKKIGSNMEIELIKESSLQKNPLSTFKLSESVISFQKSNFNKVERVPYSNFISQKKRRPSKLFAKTKK